MTATACASRGPPAVGALDPSLTTPSVLRRAPTQNQTNTGPPFLSQPRTTPHGNTSSNKPFRKPAAASSKSRAAAGRLRRPTRNIARRHRCKDLSGGTMCLSSRLLDWILLASPLACPKARPPKTPPTSEVRRFRNSGNRPVCVPRPPHPPPDFENSYIESTSKVSECM